MEVGVEEQPLGPGVKHGEESDLGFEIPAGDLEEGLGGGLEEEPEADAWRSTEERVQEGRHREDQMKVRGGQEPSLLGFSPQLLLQDLALRAVPIPTRVVSRPGIAAGVADFEVSPQSRRAASDEGADRPSLVQTQVQTARMIT
jgi:hypothetical protein